MKQLIFIKNNYFINTKTPTLSKFLKCRIKFTSTNLFELIQFETYLKKNFNILSTISLPTKTFNKITILKSPHVHKKSREQYQSFQYQKLIILNIENLNVTEFQYMLFNFLNSATLKVKYELYL